jgi:hypothetical protein
MDNRSNNLLIVASHIKKNLQYEILKNNLSYFGKEYIDIVIVYSRENKDIEYDLQTLSLNIINIFEVENDKYVDFGKWIHGLSQLEYSSYKNVLFTNDSFIITSSIDNYLQNMVMKNYDLYGFTDSTEIIYHYQSYLFYINVSHVDKLIDLFQDKYDYIQTFQDVIMNYELPLQSHFTNKDCYLKIGSLTENQGKNVFFVNDALYKILYNSQLLPIVKVKRVFVRDLSFSINLPSNLDNI